MNNGGACHRNSPQIHYYRHNKEKEEGRSLPLHSAFLLRAKLLSLGSHDLTTIVVAASLASSVGHDGFAALGANAHAGSRQLPVGTTTLVATGLGHFTLRNSHGCHLLGQSALTAFILEITYREAAVKQQNGDRAPSGNYKFLCSGSYRICSRYPYNPACTAVWNPYSARRPCE